MNRGAYSGLTEGCSQPSRRSKPPKAGSVAELPARERPHPPREHPLRPLPVPVTSQSALLQPAFQRVLPVSAADNGIPMWK